MQAAGAGPMGYAIPAAMGVKLLYPAENVIAVVGDGGFAMLMAELSTAVQHQLPIKIVVLKNNSLSEVRFEQKDLGYPNYGCDLPPIDFVASQEPFPARTQINWACRRANCFVLAKFLLNFRVARGIKFRRTQGSQVSAWLIQPSCNGLRIIPLIRIFGGGHVYVRGAIARN